MTRRRYAQLTLSQVVLFGLATNPEELLDPKLRRIDGLLDEDEFVDEVFKKLSERWPKSRGRGRYSTPAEVVLRMLVLKHVRQWSFEQLEWEVTGNVGYRHFCRIGAEKVPDAKTMVRHNQLLDGVVLRALFDRVVSLAVSERTTTGRRLRVDTTVTEAPIHFPTDSGLLEDSIRVLRRGLKRLVNAGVRLSFKLRSVSRSVSHRLREIAQALRLRGDAAKEAIKKPYRGLLRITARLIRQSRKALKAAKRQRKRRRGKLRRQIDRTVNSLEQFLPLAQQVVRQTRARVLRGVTNLREKIISVHEPWAQILRRGKLHRPTEFGMLVKVQEADGGVVTDVGFVPEKNDAPLLVPSVERHIEIFGTAPHLAATDRGFFSTDGEARIQELGVRHAVIPKPGHRSRKRLDYERQRWFRRGRAWRAGGEARISRLKHVFGMARSTYRGFDGMKRTVFWAAISNNLVAIAATT
jgi:IS5 family transposase